MAFQSRFGRAEWLRPYTSETLQQWARTGVRSVDVICPGFAADCLETLEEIAIENRLLFEQAGGERLRYVPALNDAPAHLDALAQLVRRHCSGWPGFAGGPAPHAAAELAASRERALVCGADD